MIEKTKNKHKRARGWPIFMRLNSEKHDGRIGRIKIKAK